MSRHLFVGLILLGAAVAPGLGQNTGGTRVVPKLEAIAETKLIMEGMTMSNFRGLERNLSKNPIDDQSWVYARGQALLIAEASNLLMLRPPRNQGEPIWFQRSMELRTQAQALAQVLAKKDIEQAKIGMRSLANACNRCHQAFRVQVDIVPFAPPQQPPLRKV
jgi:hypothetical protein